jgi:hypothetical protein
MFISENLDRETLELVAIDDCGISIELIENASKEELFAMIIEWIEAGDEV